MFDAVTGAIRRVVSAVVGVIVTAAIKFVNDLVQWFFDFFRSLVVWRIDSSNDAAPVGVPMRRRESATAMSIALHGAQNNYMDSGTRWFFTLDAIGRATYWNLVPEMGTLTDGISYHRLRRGEPLYEMRFDMIAANSGRVFAKRKDHNEFYFAMLEPMFRNAAGQDAPSLYFKVDPQKGQPGNDLADLVDHFVGTALDHPATFRMPLFRTLLGVDATDLLAVNVDRNLKVWHHIDARPPRDGADPPTNGSLPSTSTVITYGQHVNLFGLSFRLATDKRGAYAIKEVLDRVHWNRAKAARLLQISYKALLYKIVQCGLVTPDTDKAKESVAS